MFSRSIVLVPADRVTNIELVTQVATALAAPGAADIRILNVTPMGQSWLAVEDWRERPWVHAHNQSARTETETLSAKTEGTIRQVTGRALDDASCARELSRPCRFQRRRGMARRTATARPTREIAKRFESQARRFG